MKKSISILTLFFFVIVVFNACAPKQQPKEEKKDADSVLGKLEHYENFKSKFVDARNVDVWLPQGYDKKSSKKYAVLYMHDGQNLFEPKKSYIGVDWGIDEAITKLISDNKIQDAIVVGVWNTKLRFHEYMPEKPVYSSTGSKDALEIIKILNGEKLRSDKYLKFLVKELKPFIDSAYNTFPDNTHTFIMGSSMGGLISLYAISEYPDVFYGAGCISTHFPIGQGIVIDYMKKNLPDPKSHKIYFDYGTKTLDSTYESYQLKADSVMKAKGYEQGKNWITQKFVGDDHSERSWRKRINIPLSFLLKK
jgi:predicted alpha/beta superfamily hydrolase